MGKKRFLAGLVCLPVLLTACGQTRVAEQAELPAETAEEREVSAAAPAAAPDPRRDQAALAAYRRLLAGDSALLKDSDCFLRCREELEYTLLDLDGDGGSELLVQWSGDPCGFNAVYHYDAGSGMLDCWNYDAVEMSCRDYPLRDGTMVHQYDTCTGPDSFMYSYSLRRYQSDGETVEIAALSRTEYTGEEGGCAVCCLVDREEVDQAAFEDQMEAQITSQLLEPSAWTPIVRACS